MGNLLASVFSTADTLKRKAANFMSDPAEVTRQYFQNSNEDAGNNLNMLSQLYQNPQGQTTFAPSQWSPDSAAAQNALSNQALAAMAGSTTPAGKLTPLADAPKYGNLDRFTPRVYRQADLSAADAYVPGSQTMSGSGADKLFFANHPDYALGQGGNAGGALMEFDAAGIPGQAYLQKPGAQQMYDQGYGEFLSHPLMPSDISQNLRSMTLNASDLKSAQGRRIESTLTRAGFVKQLQDDGSVHFVSKP